MSLHLKYQNWKWIANQTGTHPYVIMINEALLFMQNSFSLKWSIEFYLKKVKQLKESVIVYCTLTSSFE